MSRVGQKFCSVCGATIENAAPPVPVTAAEPPAPAAPPEPPAAVVAAVPVPVDAPVPPPWAVPAPAAPPQVTSAPVPPPWVAPAASPALASPPAPAQLPATDQPAAGQPAEPAPAPWAQPAPAAVPPVKQGGLPLIPIIGAIAIVAVVAALAYGSYNHKPANNPFASFRLTSGSPDFASHGPLFTASPSATTGKTLGKGTMKVTPASFACDAAGSATLDVTLPASVSGGAEVTFTMDSASLGSDTVANSFNQAVDGSWTASQLDDIATLCSKYGPGKHTMKLLDATGATLAQVTFTITGAAATDTPQAATGASIVMVPTVFSCSSTTTSVSVALVLPATLKSSDSVTMTLDANALGTDTVGNSFELQSDGTWLSSAAVGVTDLCVGTPGNHVLRLLDSNKNVLAELPYVTQP